MNVSDEYAELVRWNREYNNSLFLASGVLECNNKEFVEVNWDRAYCSSSSMNNYESEKGNERLREEYLKAVGLQDVSNLDNILVSVGSTAALNATLRMVADLPKSKVVLVAPCWSMYASICNNVGVSYSFCMPSDRTKWKHTFNDIEEALASEVRALIIANPGNPTGEVFSDGVLEQIYLLCKKHEILLILDEAYWGISDKRSYFSNKHIGDDNVVIIRSLSKMFCMAGARIGFVLSSNKNMGAISQNLKAMNLVCSSICQEIALNALTNKMISKFNYNYIVENYKKFSLLEQKYNCIHVIRPDAGFFVTFSIKKGEYVSLYELSNKTGLIFRDGNGFKMDGYFRANLSVSGTMIDEAIRRLSEYIEN